MTHADSNVERTDHAAGPNTASSTPCCSERANRSAVLFLSSSSRHTCRHLERTRNAHAPAPPCLLCVRTPSLAHTLPVCSKRPRTLRCVANEQIRWLPLSARVCTAHIVCALHGVARCATHERRAKTSSTPFVATSMAVSEICFKIDWCCCCVFDWC